MKSNGMIGDKFITHLLKILTNVSLFNNSGCEHICETRTKPSVLSKRDTTVVLVLSDLTNVSFQDSACEP